MRRRDEAGPPTHAGTHAGQIDVGAGTPMLERAIAESDYLVLTLPETDETRGILTRERLFAMKPGSVLVNVARGRLVDEEALLDALGASGPLRGAGLDVFHTEPLPAEHPFYGHPRVLMTPHVSATTRGFWARQTALITENLGRFRAGRAADEPGGQDGGLLRPVSAPPICRAPPMHRAPPIGRPPPPP